MMFFLIGDVVPHALDNCFANRHRKILILPFKSSSAQFVLIYPKRRFAFYQLHYLFHRLVCAKRNQTMNVVFITVDEIKMDIFLCRVFPNMLENFLPNFISQKRLAVFG